MKDMNILNSVYTLEAIGTALVDMYAKKIGDARSLQQIFCKMEKKDVMAWTS
jgi:hypothetical protein